MSELLILGTSAGVSTVSRHHFSMAVKKDGRLYLIDCGGLVCMLLQQMGEDPRNIDNLHGAGIDPLRLVHGGPASGRRNEGPE
ncbi:hypothetical protein [uncultured Paenibacillus sp.]|uniref:hypothetical protein n=1 Tax=uncultured Paenibacillus sp. TaxID=227322 RepID=UPI0028D142E0|nr:hypothetical protein [uncultured Paenibacillus sp.]